MPPRDWPEGVPTVPWQLELGERFKARCTLFAAPATLPDGTEAVLKVHFPGDLDSEYVADALRVWDGHGAVRLIAHDPDANALLLERCRPGTPLGTGYDDQALATVAAVMQRIWREPTPDVTWPRLDDAARQWREWLPQAWLPRTEKLLGGRSVLEEGIAAIEGLLSTQDDLVLCHGDLGGRNILSAEREPWLAIDPRPIIAERAYDTVAPVRQNYPSDAEMGRRLDVLAKLLDLDRERMRLWGLVRCLAWGEPERAAQFSALGAH